MAQKNQTALLTNLARIAPYVAIAATSGRKGADRLPQRPQAKLMAQTDLPAADFGGTIRPDEVTLAAMPDKPFKGVVGKVTPSGRQTAQAIVDEVLGTPLLSDLMKKQGPHQLQAWRHHLLDYEDDLDMALMARQAIDDAFNWLKGTQNKGGLTGNSVQWPMK